MQKIDYEKYSDLLKAMSNPIRLQMIDVLLDDECCVTDVMNELKISQSTTSQHLLILKNSGIVYPQKHGTKTCYKINNEFAKDILTILKTKK